jgi:DnaD/phage-associated family protein
MAIPSQHPTSGQVAASPQQAASSQYAAPARDSDRADTVSGQDASDPAGRGTSFRHPDAASIEAFRSSAKRAQLLFVIEQYIGKPLAPSEVESVYYISEQLHFSDALIDYLLQYCIDRGKKDFRYIQKVAVNWAEHGITTPKQAERAVSSFGRKGRPSSGSGVKPSANPFNQFEQNQYDFDELEKEILGN